MKKKITATLLAVLLVCVLGAAAFAADLGLTYKATATYVRGTMTIGTYSTVSVSTNIYEEHTQTFAPKMKFSSGGLRRAKTYTHHDAPHNGYAFMARYNNTIRGISGVTADIVYTGDQIQFTN